MAQVDKAHSKGLSRHEWLAVAIGLVSVMLVIYLGQKLQPETSRMSLVEYADMSDSDAAPVVAMFGEFRGNLSYILYMKTEEYLHSGVRFRPLTEKEKQMGREQIHHEADLLDAQEKNEHQAQVADTQTDIHEHKHQHETGEEHAHPHQHETGHEDDHHHDHEHGHTHGAQIVPPKEWDVRGFFGDIEREIKPYESEGEREHAQATEMLPWYRLATYLNPRLVRAYVIGGFAIAAYGGKLDEAEAFFREGMRNNPNSIEIKEALARHLMYRKEDTRSAEPLLKAAIALGKNRTELQHDEEYSLRRAYINLALLQWKTNNDSATARSLLDEAIERFPDDAGLEQLRSRLDI